MESSQGPAQSAPGNQIAGNPPGGDAPPEREAAAGPCPPGDGSQPVNRFALVAYIPGPLGAFLDELRRELVPDCIPRAHVTVLPARSLSLPAEEAWKLICARAAEFPAFEVEPGDVEVFENTAVAYIAVGKGWRQLVELHDALSQGPLFFAEPFPYHPHITVAQDFAPDQLGRIAAQARRRWEQFPHRRSFLVESVTFVRGTADNRWLDLAACRLAAPCRR